jgi:hypothetical protein
MRQVIASERNLEVRESDSDLDLCGMIMDDDDDDDECAMMRWLMVV